MQRGSPRERREARPPTPHTGKSARMVGSREPESLAAHGRGPRDPAGSGAPPAAPPGASAAPKGRWCASLTPTTRASQPQGATAEVTPHSLLSATATSLGSAPPSGRESQHAVRAPDETSPGWASGSARPLTSGLSCVTPRTPREAARPECGGGGRRGSLARGRGHGGLAHASGRRCPSSARPLSCSSRDGIGLAGPAAPAESAESRGPAPALAPERPRAPARTPRLLGSSARRGPVSHFLFLFICEIIRVSIKQLIANSPFRSDYVGHFCNVINRRAESLPVRKTHGRRPRRALPERPACRPGHASASPAPAKSSSAAATPRGARRCARRTDLLRICPNGGPSPTPPFRVQDWPGCRGHWAFAGRAGPGPRHRTTGEAGNPSSGRH